MITAFPGSLAQGMKTFVIFNPNAGRKDPSLLKNALQSLGKVVVWPSERVGHAEELARQAIKQGAEVVIAGGGDATVGEVLNGIATHLDQIRFGILPLGTGNDFARGANIPLELPEAVEVLLRGKIRPVDVVRVICGGEVLRYFLNVAVSGFDEDAKKRMEQGFKSGWGPLGYLFAAAEAIPEITLYQIKIQLDNAHVEGLEASILVVANGSSFGGGIPLHPEALVDDGKLNVLAFRPGTSGELLLLAPAVLGGTHLELDETYHRTARRVTIWATPPLPFHIDDRYFTTCPDLTFEVLPRALRLISPAHK
jgi:diacylglycerol kinase (ATP)